MGHLLIIHLHEQFAAIAAMAATGIQEAGGSSITSTPLDAEHLNEGKYICME